MCIPDPTNTPFFQGIFQNKYPLFMVKQDILYLKPYTYEHEDHEENCYISKTKFSKISAPSV